MEIKLNSLLSEKAKESLKEILGDDELLSKVNELVIDSGEAKLIPLEKFNEQGDQVKQLTEQLKTQSEQLENLGKFKGTNEELKAKIEELQAANAEQEKNYNLKLKEFKVNAAWEKALNKANPRSAKALKALIDSEKVKYNEETGVLDGFDEEVEAIRKDNAWMFNEAPKSKAAGFADTQPNDGFKKEQEEKFKDFRNA